MTVAPEVSLSLRSLKLCCRPIEGITYQMRVFDLFKHLYVVELDVQELVDRFEGSLDRDVVLEFNGDFVIYQGFEETGELSALPHAGSPRSIEE